MISAPLDKATNVCRFPARDGYAGDIAIAYGVTSKKAKAAAKSFCRSCRHLVVHGVLHLAGYDHERPKDAAVMEPLEVKILERLASPIRMRRQCDERPSVKAPAAKDHRPGRRNHRHARKPGRGDRGSDRESPALSAQERVMLGNLLRFGELKLRDVMVPRAEIIAVMKPLGRRNGCAFREQPSRDRPARWFHPPAMISARGTINIAELEFAKAQQIAQITRSCADSAGDSRSLSSITSSRLSRMAVVSTSWPVIFCSRRFNGWSLITLPPHTDRRCPAVREIFTSAAPSRQHP